VHLDRLRKILPEILDCASDALLIIMEPYNWRRPLAMLDDHPIGEHSIALKCMCHFVRSIDMI
jgi:hypothetical protein